MHRRFPRPGMLVRVSIGVTVSVAAICVSVVTPSADAGAASKYEGRVGLSSHLVWQPQKRVRNELRRLRSGGVRWVREDFSWRSIEARRGKYDWRFTDTFMAAAAKSGFNVLAILAYSPAWASSDPSGAGRGVYPPHRVEDFARFASAVARRYGRGGTFWRARRKLPERPLAAVELWNEPAGYWNWRPNPDPAAYARLSLAAATAIRDVSPSVDVLVAGEVVQTRTDGRVVEWLGNLIAADPGLRRLIDAYAVHPYPHPHTKGPYDELSPGYLWDYRQVAVARGIALARKAGRPFWITEVGWSTAIAAPGGVTEAVQAQYVRGAVERAVVNWRAFVRRVFIYSWDRSNGDMADREGNFGLLRSDGSAKPAWKALTDLIRVRGRGRKGTPTLSPRASGP